MISKKNSYTSSIRLYISTAVTLSVLLLYCLLVIFHCLPLLVSVLLRLRKWQEELSTLTEIIFKHVPQVVCSLVENFQYFLFNEDSQMFLKLTEEQDIPISSQFADNRCS